MLGAEVGRSTSLSAGIFHCERFRGKTGIMSLFDLGNEQIKSIYRLPQELRPTG
jgi:hypothetical protein